MKAPAAAAAVLLVAGLACVQTAPAPPLRVTLDFEQERLLLERP